MINLFYIYSIIIIYMKFNIVIIEIWNIIIKIHISL